MGHPKAMRQISKSGIATLAGIFASTSLVASQSRFTRPSEPIQFGCVPKRSWSAHFDKGVTPHGWSTMQISDHKIPRQSFGQGPKGSTTPVRKPFMKYKILTRLNESWYLTRDYLGKQFALSGQLLTFPCS